MEPPQDYIKREQPDAVCFMAGPEGAVFALGVIHAYLAADREPPKAVAGVSAGALSAAAMHRCYHELEKARQSPGASTATVETARWNWYRRYLSAVVDNPWQVFWRTVPDFTDILANRLPLHEPSLPERTPEWIREEQRARKEYYLAVELVSWLLRLRLRLSAVAELAYRYVRVKEKYSEPGWMVWRWFRLLWACISVAAPLYWGLLVHPAPIRLADLMRIDKGWRRFFRRFAFRPLFGWGPYLTLLAVPGAIALAALCRLAGWDAASLSALCLLGAVLIYLLNYRVIFGEPLFSGLSGQMLANARLRDALLNDFYLRVKLHDLFAEDGRIPLANASFHLQGDRRMDCLLVAAPLDALRRKDSNKEAPVQLWPVLRPEVEGATDIVSALLACLALPPLLRPARVRDQRGKGDGGGARNHLGAWFDHAMQPEDCPPPDKLQLVDGSMVCGNPLPALFGQMKFSSRLQDHHYEPLQTGLATPPRVHLVYGMPIRYKDAGPLRDYSQEGEYPPLPNCIDAALRGLGLASRRDARLEVWQTNYQTEATLALARLLGHPAGVGEDGKRTLSVLVDELAPEKPLHTRNALSPTESELLRQAACGCRQGLQKIYHDELSRANRAVDCAEFLSAEGRSRPQWFEIAGQAVPGLPEMCQHCTRQLDVRDVQARRKASPLKSVRTEVLVLDPAFAQNPAATVPRLAAHKGPRIVFVASGGVFRGSFHVGMIGALHQAGIQPDLIVGASVGSLMGAVLGAMGVLERQQGFHLLGQLVDTFFEVDTRVGLTKRLKSAVRDLQVRASTVRLSPRDIRKAVEQGSMDSPGFAATGAPPVLIDALSRFLLIPYNTTAAIAADLVAEDVVGAVGKLLLALRDETVPRLGVADALLGTELLEKEIRRLLGCLQGRLHMAQPFQDPIASGGYPSAFFATAVNLNTEAMTILGALPGMQSKSYDFVEALLSSSAFPLAFPPRRESQIFPGLGRRDVFFGDGGIFDNLPFLPAMLVLGAVQRFQLQQSPPNERWQALRSRFAQPDLFFAGALDENPFTEDAFKRRHTYRSILEVNARAQSLAKNEKIRGFERMTKRLDKSLRTQVQSEPVDLPPADALEWEMLDRYVHAAVLAVEPTSRGHLNKTFAFSRTTGLQEDRVALSIADGCYQTFSRLRHGNQQPSNSLEGRAFAGLSSRLPQIEVAPRSLDEPKCPFFISRNSPFDCPFARLRGGLIYQQCLTHRRSE